MDREVACAELLGMMMGDGCLSNSKSQVKYWVYCSGNKLKDKEYFAKYVPSLFYQVFEKSVIAKERTDENTIYIKFSDKKVFLDLKERGIPVGRKYERLCIPDFVKKNREREFAFMRGMFDTDGCIVWKKHEKNDYPRIEISSKSEKFLISLLALLKEHGFSGSISNKGKGQHRLELPGFKNLGLWFERVGSSNERNIMQVLSRQKLLKGSISRCADAPIAQPVERASK